MLTIITKSKINAFLCFSGYLLSGNDGSDVSYLEPR